MNAKDMSKTNIAIKTLITYLLMSEMSFATPGMSPADVRPGTIFPTNYAPPSQNLYGLQPTPQSTQLNDIKSGTPTPSKPKKISPNCEKVGKKIDICQ